MERYKIIGIAGGSGSGKTTLAQILNKALGDSRSVILAQDHYYRDQSHRFDEDGGSVNFDHPDSLDLDLLAQNLRELRSSPNIEVPVYDFATHRRLGETSVLERREYIIVEGTLIYSNPAVRGALDHLVFVQTPEDIRYQRRLDRDVQERGRKPEGVRVQFEKQVKPMHDLFVEPSKAHADLIVSGQDHLESLLNVVAKKFGIPIK